MVPPSTTTVLWARARRSRASASSRSCPQATILAIIESNWSEIWSHSRTPESTRTPLPGRKPEHRDPTGSGHEALLGVLGAQPRLDGVAARRRGLALQPLSLCHAQLQLDQVEARGRLGDRVLDLEPGIDLHEEELLRRRLDEELHRAGVAVARRGGQADGGRPDRGLGGGGQGGGR